MKPLLDGNLEDYAVRMSEPPSPLLEELYKETYASTDLPQMLIGPWEASFLRFLVRTLNASRILEIGTFTGYSALAMAEALPPEGRLVTLDINPETTAMAQRFWDRSPHGKKIELRLAPAVESLERLEGPFDLIFIDADKENYRQYWDQCIPRVRPGGVLAVDNTLWSGGVLNPQSETDHAVAAFNEYVKSDARVHAVMLTIRDGLTVAWKKG